jgi:hypothetical protein
MKLTTIALAAAVKIKKDPAFSRGFFTHSSSEM